jgi:hypothetical protein
MATDLQANVEPGIDGVGELPHRGHGTGLAVLITLAMTGTIAARWMSMS